MIDSSAFKIDQFVVEADIKGFFDNIGWEWTERMLEQRIADGATTSEADGDMELLWAHRQSSPNEAVLRRDLPAAAQVAQPAESAKEFDLASTESAARAFPGTATANRGKEVATVAFPAGTGFGPRASGFSATWSQPAGVCMSELT